MLLVSGLHVFAILLVTVPFMENWCRDAESRQREVLRKQTCSSFTPFATNLTRASPLLSPHSAVRRQGIKDWTILWPKICSFFYIYIQNSISTSHRTVCLFYNMHKVIQFMDTVFILCNICRNSTRQTWQNTDL